MSQFYELVASGAPPIDLTETKLILKVDDATDDVLIQTLIDAAIEYGEKHTGRSFRIQTFKLHLDIFEARVCLRKSPVDVITSVTHLVSDSPVTVASTVYYLKKGPQYSTMLLSSGESWPTDTDEREQAIVVNFATNPVNCGNSVIIGLYRWITYAYTNRGDWDDPEIIGKLSGAEGIFDYFSIVKV